MNCARKLVPYICLCIGTLLSAQLAPAQQPPGTSVVWQTVVNNGDPVPSDGCGRNFNSYNPPSVNDHELVVFRARSKGGPPCGQAAHGIYTRQMPGAPVMRILDRTTAVPAPNNLGTSFGETPAFPRIDAASNAIATRANHQPVWQYTINSQTTRAGTSGIYGTPGGAALVTGASKLGAVPGFSFYAVPGAPSNTFFEVFPGAPSPADATTIVFKGNYTEGVQAHTGVYFRDLQLASAGGASPVELIANNAETMIPGTSARFGSLAPPSGAKGQVVFAGFDDENAPTAGGIYFVRRLTSEPELETLVSIGGAVPDEESGAQFNRLAEAISFDGRAVAFWGAWGNEMRSIHLTCPSEGNAARIAYCLEQYPTGYTTSVPVHQGIFVADTRTRTMRTVAKTGEDLLDFLFWNFSGMVPGSEEGDDGEPARWRSSPFLAVSGTGVPWRTVFKAQTTGGETGIYAVDYPGQREMFTLVDTTTDGKTIDPEAPYGSKVTELGLERDGLRKGTLVLNVTMEIPGEGEESGWAGIYLSDLPRHFR